MRVQKYDIFLNLPNKIAYFLKTNLYVIIIQHIENAIFFHHTEGKRLKNGQSQSIFHKFEAFSHTKTKHDTHNYMNNNKIHNI